MFSLTDAAAFNMHCKEDENDEDVHTSVSHTQNSQFPSWEHKRVGVCRKHSLLSNNVHYMSHS